MKNPIGKPFLGGLALVLTLLVLTSVAPVSADLDAWSWTDMSTELPRRDEVRFTSAASRQGEWLLSNGSNLWRFDGVRVSDLTQEARDRGLRSIKLIASDNRSWIIWNKNADDARGQLLLRGPSGWTDVTHALPPTVEALDVNGHAGAWALRATSHGTSRTILLPGANAIPADVTLPIGASALPTGCVKEASGSTLCTGVNRVFNAGGMWFLIGSATEARAANGEAAEKVSIKLWRLSGTELISLKNLPAAKFVSGVWQTDAGVMVATSESPLQPRRADRLWLFNGHKWRDLTKQAKALGLLPTDTSGMQVAHGGASWMIVSGNKLYRYDGASLRSKGDARTRVHVLAGGEGFVLGGQDASGLASLFFVRDQVADEKPEPMNVNAVAPVATPRSVTLAQNVESGISYASWTDPSGSSLLAGNSVIYVVAGQEKTDGLASIEVWVNGKNVKTCAANQTKAEFRCETMLSGSEYPTGTDLFMNARLTDAAGHAFWIPATTLTRPAGAAPSEEDAQPVMEKQAVGVFASRLSLEPALRDVRRGTTITVRAKSENNSVGLERVEISYAGQVHRICRYGVAMSETVCDLTIDTSALAENTMLSFVARAIDAEGRETWSNGESVTVRGTAWNPTPSAAADAKGFSQWSWLTPELAELENSQEATYTVGAWSPQGVKSVEIVANGAVRKSCNYLSGSASRECAYVLKPSDWNHGDTVTVNARITDHSGNIIWSAPKTLLMTRGWWEPVNRPSAYVHVTASRNDGYQAGDTLTFTMLGWSPNGADRLELLVDGKVVASCPSDVCRWTSGKLDSERLEFQARLTDRVGKHTWSGLSGLKKQ